MGLPLRKTSLLPLAVETALFCIGFLLEYEQWGIATQNGYATAYPVTFPSRCLAVVATYVLREASSYWQKPLSLQAITRSSFTAATASSWGANDTARWIAIGV